MRRDYFKELTLCFKYQNIKKPSSFSIEIEEGLWIGGLMIDIKIPLHKLTQRSKE